jgi:hypothetical protein
VAVGSGRYHRGEKGDECSGMHRERDAICTEIE